MRDSKEKLARNNPESNLESGKSPSFLIHKTHPERNKSQHLRRTKLETESDLEYMMPSIGLNDREKLQQTIIALKTEINAVNNENMKLRSKTMMLEKEAQKLRLVAQNKVDPRQKQPRQLQRLCNTLKDRLRERNAQYQFLETQHNNLKKSIKKTRINEMEIENQNLLLELQKMAKLYLELAQYREKTSSERQEWKKAAENLKEKSHYAKMLESQLERLQKNEQDMAKLLEETKQKLQNADQRRIKETNELKRMIKSLSGTATSSPNPIQAHAHPQPVKSSYKPTPRQKTERKKTEEVKSERDNRVESKSKEIEAKGVKPHQLLPHPPSQSQPPNQSQRTHTNTSKQSHSNSAAKVQKQQQKPVEKQPLIEQPKPSQPEIIDDDQYGDDGFEQDKPAAGEKVEQNDQYGDDYEQDEEAEPEEGQSIEDIIDFMTYRLRINKINRNKLVSMIDNCDARTLQDFSRFIQKEPFGIKNPQQNELMLSYLSTDIKSVKEVRQKFVDLIPDYKCWSTSQQQTMTARIKQVVEEYAVQINDVLGEYDDNKNAVQKSVLVKLLAELELQPQEIDYVIAKLSLRSMDLKHLNYKELSELFVQNEYSQDEFQPHFSIKKQPADVELSDGSYEQL